MYNNNNHFWRRATFSPHLSLTKLHFKLDFRLIIKDFNDEELDVTTGELARQASTTSSKMHKDFTESAQESKVNGISYYATCTDTEQEFQNENHASTKKCLQKIEAQNYANKEERATKLIYVHM